jgi:molybdenum cofactor synthesis domain-containing protein
MLENKLVFWVITLSDRASRGEYEDLSGPGIEKQLKTFFKNIEFELEINKHLIPDDPVLLEKLLLEARGLGVNAIFTTGGTGIGPRDYTPDVVKSLIDKEIPGIMEMIRVKYGMVKPNALISRGVAGTIGKSLVYTLPGSLRAVAEYCSEILPTILHSMKMIHGVDDHS